VKNHNSSQTKTEGDSSNQLKHSYISECMQEILHWINME